MYLRCCFYQLAKMFVKCSKLGITVKLGKGTSGEAYKAGSTVCKVVPSDGYSFVN